ncbi:hypothetical protein GP486_002025 [Trichoglossum hirsutum]|uniref:DUF7708 domain-containing protein n=1 Tax=Trichoglossum hirsutum TaxID=265104 RepID=A0A9P8RS30_9PEZI|nr:hypothetical protein GP486_002025 [Trichoglossum hirsutum]
MAVPEMSLSQVSNFLANEGGKFAGELANPGADALKKAQALYLAYNDTEATSAYFNDNSLEDLQSEATQAWKAYESHQNRRRNWRHPFEVLDKAAGSVAYRIEFLIELIPDGEYTSILFGSLKLAYNTAKRKREVREQILELFDSLSDRISHTKAKIKLYSQDTELRDKSEDLYMSILDGVRHCVVWLNKTSALESFKAFFQQSCYGAKLDEAMDNIEKKAIAFENCVEDCFQRRVQDIHENVEWMKQPIMATFFLLAGFVKDFPSQLEELKSIMAKATQNVNPTIQYIQQPIAPATAISSQQLLQALSTNLGPADPSSAQSLLISFESDIRDALRHCLTKFNEEQVGLLMGNGMVTAWLKSLTSQFIIIHDEKSLQSLSGLSTLSYFCALMSKTLRCPGMWALSFFCGLHSAAESNLQGGKGIMSSLTLQLLLAFGDAVFPINADPYIIMQRLLMNDLDTICYVFSLLLSNIPAGVVYCIIDGAHWYSTQARSDETRAVIRYLMRLVTQTQAAGRGLLLKVLVTNPTPRQHYSWGLQAVDVYLEQDLLASGHRGDVARMIASASSETRFYGN